MSVSAEARELAGKTAAEIRRRGWTQGSMADISYDYEPDTEGASGEAHICRVCLVGGIAAALTGDPRKGDDLMDGYVVKPSSLLELMDEFGRAAGLDNQNRTYLYDLVTWNDKFGRTEAEVLALLDSIAADQ